MYCNLCRCSTGADPTADTIELYGRLQNLGVGDKNPQQREGEIQVGFTSPTGLDTRTRGRPALGTGFF